MMSSGLEQEFFSDGITEEITNVLAQVPKLKVIEGSVRRSLNKFTAQLIQVSD